MNFHVGNTVTRIHTDGTTLRGRVNDLTDTHARVLWDGWALPTWESLSELTVDPWLQEAAAAIRAHQQKNSE